MSREQLQIKLDQLGFLSKSMDNNCLSVFARSENGFHVMTVISEAVEFGDTQVLEFWGVVDEMTTEEALSPEHMEDLLKENCNWPMGAWSLRNLGETLGLCFSIKLISDDGDLPVEKIQLAVNGITHVVGLMREDMGFAAEED